MSYKIAGEFLLEEKTMGNAYVETMLDLFEQYPNIVQVEADLAKVIWGLGFKDVMKKFPNQCFNVGIQEANLVGVACGLSLKGLIPFAHSLSPFLARRANDAIFISGCYNKSNVRLVGNDPGIMAKYNGGTHSSFEDIAAIRSFAGLTILEPSDIVQLESILRQLADLYGMYYIRFTRDSVNKLYENGSAFEIGKGIILIEGSDVTIIASGPIMLSEAIKASAILKDEGISARVIDMFTIKPIDDELVVKCAKETGAIVTAENHSVIGGLGGAVSEVLGEKCPTPIERVGVKEEFGEVGAVQYLLKRFKLTADDIAEAARRAVSRK